MLESWLPAINADNAFYVLMRRNQMSANDMVATMADNVFGSYVAINILLRW